MRDGCKAEDRLSLSLGAEEIVSLNLLLLTPEARLEGRTIDSWFAPEFFKTNFWIMWSTMFSFQPWHSLAEMQRYMRRFLHLLPGLTRNAGILRTRYNQYDSIVAPICAWLTARGVALRGRSGVADVTIAGDMEGRRVTAAASFHRRGHCDCRRGPRLSDARLDDRCDRHRQHRAPPPTDDGPCPSFDLWRRLAARHEGLGRPDVSAGNPERTAWTSFTVTLASPAFVTSWRISAATAPAPAVW